MDFQSAMETFAEAWVAANTQTPLTEAAEAQNLLMSQTSLGACLQDLSDRGRVADQDGDSSGGSRNSGLRSPSQSLVSLSDFSRINKMPSPSGPGKSVPVHCVVEQMASPPTTAGQTGDCIQPGVEVDSFAIVPCSTLFNDLVRTALIKLGYSASEAVGAKGVIQIKHWKPLTFDQITEASEATVGDILGEITNVVTLRIRLYSRPKMNAANDVKEKLLQVLIARSQSILLSSGCPIDQNVLNSLCKGRVDCDISEETRKKFDQWYFQQIFHHCRQVALLQQHMQQQQQQQQQSQPELQPLNVSTKPHPPNQVPDPPRILSHQSHGRTRIRTSFDPELELPKLHKWFAENPHPSRLQIQQYVKELNSLESRRGRKPLDLNNVVYWFKNARAALKRSEQRYGNDSNGGTYSDETYEDGPSIQNPSNLPAVQSRLPVNVNIPSTKYSLCNGDNNDSPIDCRNLHYDSQTSANDTNGEHTLDLSMYGVNSQRYRSFQSSGNEKQSPASSPIHESALMKEEPHESSTDQSDDSDESGDENMEVSDDGCHVREEMNEESNGLAISADYPGGDQKVKSENPGSEGSASSSIEERRKRNRTFIDPMTEVPRLEQWFTTNTHPAHTQIVCFTEELNNMPYRQKFPKLEPKNIQFWFKNRRAKCKRLSLNNSIRENSTSSERLPQIVN